MTKKGLRACTADFQDLRDDIRSIVRAVVIKGTTKRGDLLRLPPEGSTGVLGVTSALYVRLNEVPELLCLIPCFNMTV